MRPATQSALRGFSLLELLVALSIMAMALGLLYQASIGALRGAGDLELEERATVLAQSLLETRDAIPEGGWNESGRSAGMDWRVATSLFATTATSANPAIVPLHEVRLQVAWASTRGRRLLELRTLLPQQRLVPGTERR